MSRAYEQYLRAYMTALQGGFVDVATRETRDLLPSIRGIADAKRSNGSSPAPQSVIDSMPGICPEHSTAEDMTLADAKQVIETASTPTASA